MGDIRGLHSPKHDSESSYLQNEEIQNLPPECEYFIMPAPSYDL